MKFRNTRLENGLEIVAECNPAAHSTAIGFFVRTGSRDESDAISGVSHFLEHMVFKGTPSRTADDVNREFDEMGAHYNAYTTEESTVFYGAILPEKQLDTAKLLADLMRPSLREEDFKMEKEVIIEEIQMYFDQPPFGADDVLKERFFADHPLARSVLGSVESIRALPVDAMHDYFSSRYVPGNLFVAASGNVDFDRLVDTISTCCGEWRNAPTSRATPAVSPQPGFESIVRKEATQQYILQLSNAPCGEDDDRYAAKVLATILADDAGSRIYWELVDTGIAEHVSLGHYEYDQAGLYYTWASCAPEKTDDVLGTLFRILRNAGERGVSQSELDQAKSKIKARVVLGSERPRNRLFAVGGNWLQRQRYLSVGEELAKLAAVSVDDVQDVLQRFPFSSARTLTIGPRVDLKPPTA